MALLLLTCMMVTAVVLWLDSSPRPKPVKIRRNLLQEELLAAYARRDPRL